MDLEVLAPSLGSKISLILFFLFLKKILIQRRFHYVFRRNARDERVLFHYNGHGVPKPTSNGEIWVFNRSYTQYIPLSLYDLQSWLVYKS